MTRLIFFHLLIVTLFGYGNLFGLDYLISPQVYNPVDQVKQMQSNLPGSFFATMDDHRQIDVYNSDGVLVLSWHDPDPDIEINPDNGSKAYLKKINAFRLFPRSKKFIAATSRGNRLSVVDYNGRVLKKGTVGKNIQQIYISPDESRFLIVPNEHYALLTDNTFRTLKKIPVQGIKDVSFSGDSRFMVFAEDAVNSGNGWKASMRLFTRDGAYVRDIENDRPGQIVDTPDGPVEGREYYPASVTFSPDGKHIAYYGQSGRDIRVVSTRDKKIYQFRAEKMLPYYPLSFSRDGEHLAVVTEGYSGTLDYYTLKGEKERSVPLRKEEGKAQWYYFHRYACYLPSQERVALVEEDSSYYNHGTEPARIKIIDRDGRGLRINGNNPLREITDIRIKPDGSEIAVQRKNGDLPSLIIDTENSEISELNGSVMYDTKGNRAVSQWIMTGPEGRKRKSNIMQYTIGSKSFRVAGGGLLLPNHYVAQPGDYASTKTNWVLFNDNGEALRKIYPGYEYEHGDDFSPDMKMVLYRADLRRFSDNRRIKFFFDKHLVDLGRFNPSGTKVITGLEFGELMIWKLDGSHGPHIKGHVCRAVGAGMTRDDRIMVSAGRDNRIIIRNLQSGTVAYMYFFRGNKYLIYTNTGRYDFNGDSRHLVDLSRDGKVVTGDHRNARVRNLLHKVIRGEI